MFDRFDRGSRTVLSRAEQIAHSLGARSVGVAHVVAAVREALATSGSLVPPSPAAGPGRTPLSYDTEVLRLLYETYRRAIVNGTAAVTPRDLLASIETARVVPPEPEPDVLAVDDAPVPTDRRRGHAVHGAASSAFAGALLALATAAGAALISTGVLTGDGPPAGDGASGGPTARPNASPPVSAPPMEAAPPAAEATQVEAQPIVFGPTPRPRPIQPSQGASSYATPAADVVAPSVPANPRPSIAGTEQATPVPDRTPPPPDDAPPPPGDEVEVEHEDDDGDTHEDDDGDTHEDDDGDTHEDDDGDTHEHRRGRGHHQERGRGHSERGSEGPQRKK